MWTIVLTAAVAVVATVEGGLLYATAPQDRGQYLRGSSGTYNYGYNTGDGVAKVEVRRADGSVVGSYRYFDPNGKQIVRSYVADSKGFRILGNDLPISPETPAASIIGAPALTAAVEGAHQTVVDAALHPTKSQNTIDIQYLNSLQPLARHSYQHQLVIQQQNALLLQQQKLIEQQKQQLAALVSQQQTESSQVTVRQDAVQVVPTETVQYSAVESSNVLEDTAPHYYYYPYKYDYDFPAGFAYSGGLVKVERPSIIGVRGLESERNKITVGRSHVYSPAQQPPIEVVGDSSPRHQRPYVIGRMK